MTDFNLQSFEKLSPFEIKDELIKLAKKSSQRTQSAFLNAGRGNPNWIATTPREGFFLLGQFAITESKRVMEHAAGLGGMPKAQGIARRLEAWLNEYADMPGAVISRRNGAVRGARPSVSIRMRLCTSWWIPSSVTTIRFRIACSSTTSASPTST